MIGCDVSPKMVDKARATGAYTAVRVQDIHDALREEKAASLDLVLSADTFIYVGKLEDCFHLTTIALRPGGLFAFSIEDLVLPSKNGNDDAAAGNDDDAKYANVKGFQLVASGRYAHTQAYITRLCETYNFACRLSEAIVVRKEQTLPIPGRLYVLEKIESAALVA